MKFDLNEAIRDVLDFLKTHWKPSLAKYIIWPSMTVGLASLSVPLWIDIANWALVHQNFFPSYQFPIVQPNYPLGVSLIGLSVLVYFLDVWLKKNNELPNKLIEIPSQVANEITTRMRSAGFTAQHLQDERIEELSSEITFLRFFGSFPKEDKATTLAESIIDGELSGGTPQVKARALAKVARYLCIGEKADLAKKWLSHSKKLCQTEEAAIAQAFIEATGSNKIDAASGLLMVSNPSNYAAFFMIKKTVDGNEAALSWFESTGLSLPDVDIDGKVILLSVLLTEHQWEKALDLVQKIDDESLSVSPALAQLSAFTFLVNAIKAVELRDSVLNYIPLAAERFPLADDSESVVLRNRAVDLFKVCSVRARYLGAEDVANMSDQYVLWLQLRNNETYEQAIAELQSYFVSYNQKTLEYFPLAFSFGIDIDFESIENEVNRQTALSPANNAVLGLARFILAQTQKPISAAVDYISRHRNQMEMSVNSVAISLLEIEALAKSGLVDDAQQLLDKTGSSGASDAEVRNLQNIIDLVMGADPVALAISQYQQSEATSDLAHLVNLLERNNRGDRYYLYCRELFDRTGQESDAIRVCNAASSLGKFSELHQFLSDRTDLVKRSEVLQAHWAWCLFRKGDLSGTHEQIARLKQSKSQLPDLKSLEINLSIFSGDWESLSIFVENSWNSREELNANDLLQAAHLAKAISPGRAKQILEFCTGKYRDDPQVFASSYFIATTMGSEDNQETSAWLNKAIVLSNENGPLHKASFEDLKDMISESKEKNERVYKAYFDGDAPIFTVAELLNRTMSDFYLLQPLENKNTKDIRRKNVVPVFHGARSDQVIAGEIVAVDASSTLMMENLGILNQLFDCFQKIIIPHSFMRWLFEEKQKVAFHQPSQIEKAKYFERLVSDGKISVFHPKKINNPELALDVGEELAFMLEEVRENPANEVQSVVVCSYPVYKVGGTFREEEAELSSFHYCLTSCSLLVKKLKELAVITESQCTKALNYLNQHEKEWPVEIEVASGARLFLDSLSITYLITVDMLDRLSDAGFEVYVFKGERDKYRSLISHSSIIEQEDSKIENIRKFFLNGLTSGKVMLAEMPLNKDQTAASNNNYSNLTEELFEALKICDSALIDDRFMNKHRDIAFDGRTAPIYTSLDFIETLHYKELISQEQKFEARTLLREFGLAFVGISNEELEYHLNHSVVSDGEFKPTKQLRMIRENLFLIRISGLVQLPRDAQWLHETMKTIAKAIRTQWSDDIPPEVSRARSCWLYDLMGYREWAQSHKIRGNEGMAYLGEALAVHSVLMPPEHLSDKQKNSYKAWLDEFVLKPLKDNDPWSFKYVIGLMKQQIESIANNPMEIAQDE
ncbi:PIN domain-containing protein [Vibrio parahaemolyticus]|uniref:HTH domain-containing protein n=2 Tax=Vibrio parahaemolyticus TaxID=670 RepID=UPI003007D677